MYYILYLTLKQASALKVADLEIEMWHSDDYDTLFNSKVMSLVFLVAIFESLFPYVFQKAHWNRSNYTGSFDIKLKRFCMNYSR